MLFSLNELFPNWTTDDNWSCGISSFYFYLRIRHLPRHRHALQFSNVSFNGRLESAGVRKRTHTIAKSEKLSASTITLLSLHDHLQSFQVLNIFPFVSSWIKTAKCQFKYENHNKNVKYSTKTKGPL